MKQIKIGSAVYPVLGETILYPSGNAVVRNRLEVHMAVDGMAYADFEGIFNGKDLSSIVIEEYKGDEAKEDELANSLSLSNYVYIASVGKKRVDTVNPTDGAVKSEMHYVCELEQPLYMELLAMNLQTQFASMVK